MMSCSFCQPELRVGLFTERCGLQVDHCNLPNGTSDIDAFYNSRLKKMRDCLNSTGRTIHLDVCAHSCYDSKALQQSPGCWEQWYTNATRLGNSWRTTTDIRNTWASVLRNWYRNDNFALALPLSPFNGPNQWNVGLRLACLGFGGAVRKRASGLCRTVRQDYLLFVCMPRISRSTAALVAGSGLTGGGHGRPQRRPGAAIP
jgi:hypothetical protein